MMDSDRDARVHRDVVLPLLNPHLAENINLGEHVVCRSVPALALLTQPTRFDLLIKYRYAHDHLHNRSKRWSRWAYLEHIRAFNDFKEPDGSKLTPDDFLCSFEAVIESVAADGFRTEWSVVPVSPTGAVVDGAHRVAACAAADVRVATVEVDPEPKYAFRYFLDRGLDARVADEAATEFCRLNSTARLFIVWGEGLSSLDEARSALRQRGDVFYEKEIKLSGDGPRHVMRHVYAGEPWLGDAKNDYRGAARKAERCFVNRTDLAVFVVALDLKGLAAEKARFRTSVGVGNDSCHTTETAEETLRLARLLLNDNSIECINRASTHSFKSFELKLQLLRSILPELGLDEEQVCLGGSAILGALGIRPPMDLDLISPGPEMLAGAPSIVTSHVKEAKHYPHAFEEIGNDPRLHLWWGGVKIASPSVIREMKLSRAERKDLLDAKALAGERPPRWWRLRQGLQRFRGRLRRSGGDLLATMARWTPKPLRPAARWVYGALQRIQRLRQHR